MAFNFPDSPNVNDEYTAGDRTWVWDGTVWLDKGSTLSFSELTNSTHASTHESGGSDEIEIAQSQVTGLDTGTEGFTAVSNGSSGLSYQPVSHNYIINGAFDIWQRGETRDLDSGDDLYTADRWYGVVFGADLQRTESKVAADLDGFNSAWKWQRDAGTTDAAFCTLTQTFPNEESAFLIGKTVTVSAYVKRGADYSGTQTRIRIRTGDGTDENLSLLGTVLAQEFFTPTSSWQRVSLTATIPTTETQVAVQFGWSAGGTAGADDSYYITGVQLEAGSIATPFKRNANSIAGELHSCRRFFRKSYNQADAPGTATRLGDIKGANYPALTTGKLTATVQFDQPMRGNPSVEVYDYDGTKDQITRRTLGVSLQNKAVDQTFDIGETGFTAQSDSGNSAGLIAFHYTAEDEL